MKIWILQTGEPLHIDQDNSRTMRGMNLANKLVEKGHNVILWSSTFNHRNKSHRFSQDKVIKINENLELILIHSPGYQSNVSFKRIYDHFILGIKLNKVLFLDIETAPVKYNFEELSPEFQNLWAEKTAWQRKEDFTASEFYKKKAGVMAEFSKVICISVGYMFLEKGENHLRIKSFYAADEKELLSDFILLLNKEFNTKSHMLCAHNGKEFDFPFLADKLVWETTINTFKENHPELKINYIYTGPSELNSKKKTHMLLYVFTEKVKSIKNN